MGLNLEKLYPGEAVACVVVETLVAVVVVVVVVVVVGALVVAENKVKIDLGSFWLNQQCCDGRTEKGEDSVTF